MTTNHGKAWVNRSPVLWMNGALVDNSGHHIKTYSELYLEAVKKDNHQVGVEWEALGQVTGNDVAAIRLADMQGARSMKLAAKYGYGKRLPNQRRSILI